MDTQSLLFFFSIVMHRYGYAYVVASFVVYIRVILWVFSIYLSDWADFEMLYVMLCLCLGWVGDVCVGRLCTY